VLEKKDYIGITKSIVINPLKSLTDFVRDNDFMLTHVDEESTREHLEEEWRGNEDDDGEEVLELRALLQYGFQLSGVRHQQRHIQHALCYTLLGGIVVQVERFCGLTERNQFNLKKCIQLQTIC